VKHLAITGILSTMLSTATAKTTPKVVAAILAVGLAVSAVVLATKAEGSNFWIGPEAGVFSPNPTAKNMTQLSYALAGSNYAVTPAGQIWVWPNNDRGKGGSAVYAGTYWDSYYHRGSSMHAGWSSAMMAIGRATRPGLTNGDNTGGYQGYIGGSKLNWNTGNPGGPVGSDPFTGYGIPSSGAQLWPD